MLSADGHQIPGWVTAPGVLRAIARQISTAQAPTAQAQTAQAQTAQAQTAPGPGRRRAGDHVGPGALPQHPPTPLPGYQFTPRSPSRPARPPPAAVLADVSSQAGATPVIILRGHQLRPSQPGLTLAAGNRVSLLTAAPGGPPERDPGGGHHAQPAADGTSHHS